MAILMKKTIFSNLFVWSLVRLYIAFFLPWSPDGADAQTTTYTYQASGCSGACSLWYFAANANAATAPVILYIPGGGYTNQPDLGCTNPPTGVINSNTCPEFTDWTNHGYDVYEVRYPVYGDTGNPTWPQMGQAPACALSYSVTNGLPGNWKNVTLAGDSAGGGIALVIGMGPVGKYLTDGNANCASSNTSWVVTAIITNSATTCMSNQTNCYCHTAGVARCIEVFGGDPAGGGAPEVQALDASATQYVSTWIAKGAPPILQVTSLNDGTVAPAQQALLPAATLAAGHPTLQVQYNGYDHLNDQGLANAACPSSSCSWPLNLQTVAYHSSPNCLNSAATCNLFGLVVDPAWSRFLFPSAAGASGGSFAAGGS